MALQGARRLKRQLDVIAQEFERAGLQKATLEAATIVGWQVSTNAAAISPDLARAVKIGPAPSRRRNGAAAGIAVNHPLWAIIEFGTKAHVINVKERRVLSGDGQVYGTRVSHPGARARPYIRPAFDARKDEALAAIARASRRQLREAVRRT